jgi:hypothetical protein
VVNLDFRQGLPVPLNVVTLRGSSGAVKGSRGADGTAATVRVKVHGCWLRGYILATIKNSWCNGGRSMGVLWVIK